MNVCILIFKQLMKNKIELFWTSVEKQNTVLKYWQMLKIKVDWKNQECSESAYLVHVDEGSWCLWHKLYQTREPPGIYRGAHPPPEDRSVGPYWPPSAQGHGADHA